MRIGGSARCSNGCAGPGFIGFSVLAEGMCDVLWLTDVDPQAIECVTRTIETNRLQNRVRTLSAITWNPWDLVCLRPAQLLRCQFRTSILFRPQVSRYGRIGPI